ncbi:peroxiredoxin family protein [Tundrisphaera sp. TA3]|uniref:peroxiredoxin family protein n=1 Tax=Tundrisphaera sp. TA3 TaxID=3435775 RepID=UPI003EB74DBB
MTSGRVGALVVLGTIAGFVGGVWMAATGAFDRLIVMSGPIALPAAPPPPPPRAIPKPGPPKIPAVAAPPRRIFSGGNSFGLKVGRLDLMPSPGCFWEIEPRAFQLDRTWHETTPEHTLVVYASARPKKDAIQFLVTQTARKGSVTVPLRVVLFEEDGTRRASLPTWPAGGSTGSDGQLEVALFGVNGMFGDDPAKIAYFGIERVAPDSAERSVVAAQAEASARKMAILPPARLGQPYPFDLPTADGKRARAQDHRGQAVIVVVEGESSWTAHTYMNVRRAIESNGPGEVAAVGVSFDSTLADTEQVLKKIGLQIPLVLVPNDAATRRIWVEGGQIDRLPTCYLIDRDGVLRFVTGNGFDLADRVSDLYGRPRQFPPDRKFIGPPRILPRPTTPPTVIRPGGPPARPAMPTAPGR